MYKIMLADDEGIVIDSLKFIIEKEFGDECEIEYAKTGRSVIELAGRMHPDIAIMDIQMPGINGIEAIGEIKAHDPDIIFIIMTAYDKFIYAKEAVALGVFEYLNKPIIRSEIIRVLRDAMAKIDQERQKRSRELQIRERMDSVVPILENGFVYDIMFRENYSDDVENFRNVLDIKEDYGLMAIVVCGEALNGNQMTNPVGSSVRIQKGYTRIRESLKRYLNCVIGSAMGNKIVLFLPYDKKKMDYEDRIELMRNSRTMLKAMNEEHDAMFRMGFGTVQRLEDLPYSYNEAVRVLANTDGRVVHADDLPMEKNYDADYPIETEKELFEAIEKKDINAAVLKANEFFDWMERCHADDLDDIRLKAIEFVIRTESSLFNTAGGVYAFQSRKNYLSDVLNMSELFLIRNWMVEKITQSCQKARLNQNSHSENAVSRACKYIKENFGNTDISLDEVSREVDISPYYFSKLFKEDTGKNFIDYLTQIRMDKAKELLASTSYSMKEICGAIGYADPNYFSRTFKKNVGVTPTEYKEKGGIL